MIKIALTEEEDMIIERGGSNTVITLTRADVNMTLIVPQGEWMNM